MCDEYFSSLLLKQLIILSLFWHGVFSLTFFVMLKFNFHVNSWILLFWICWLHSIIKNSFSLKNIKHIKYIRYIFSPQTCMIYLLNEFWFKECFLFFLITLTAELILLADSVCCSLFWVRFSFLNLHSHLLIFILHVNFGIISRSFTLHCEKK
jgi:hypothetical protein